jgi:hypothetical protein
MSNSPTELIIGHVIPFTQRMTRNYLAFRDLIIPNVRQVFLVPDQEISQKEYHAPLDCVTVKDKTQASYLEAIEKSGVQVLVISEELIMNYHKVRKQIPIYYIHHGFVNYHVKIKNKKVPWPSNVCELYFGVGHGFNLFGEAFKLKPEKIRILPGLPQIDYLLELKQNPPKMKYKQKKTILYVFGSTPNDAILQKEFRTQFRTFWKPFLANNPDVHLIIKAKKDYYIKQYCYFWKQVESYKLMRDGFKRKQITILPINVPLYDYLFADVVVIQEGGSAFIESLMVNPRTVLMQMTEGTRTPYLGHEKFPKLFHCQEEDELSSYLEKLLKDDSELLTPEYVNETLQFVASHVGTSPSKVCTLILKEIRDHHGDEL